MATFEDHWSSVLSASADGGDVLASIREEAINHYLDRHFVLDRPRYSVVRDLVGKVDVGGIPKDLPIKVTLSAKSPLIVDFTPFVGGAVAGSDWNDIGSPDPTPNLSQPNIRVRVEKVAFSIEWSSVYEPGVKYTWSPSPILFEAEARIELVTIKEPEPEARYVLRLQPTKARFARPDRVILDKELSQLIARLPVADAKIVTRYAVDRFDELLVIALNTGAMEFAPRFAASVEIPVPIVAEKRLAPRSLLISDNIATVGLGLDDGALRGVAEETLSRIIGDVNSALEEDIEAAGGLRNLVVANPASVDWDDLESIKRAEILEPDKVAVKLMRTQAVAKRHEHRGMAEVRRWDALAQAPAAASPVIKDGVAVAINEYFLDSVAATFTHSARDCTSWADLGAVRGRACYWVRLFDPDIAVKQVSGNLQVGGQIGVDVGGSLEGCVRKFWDCSWRWACSELRMAIKGRPGVDITLRQDRFVAIAAKITGELRLETNLPFPFDKIVKAISSLVWEGVKAVLNALLAHIQIVIVPPKLEIPQQTTKILLSDFSPRFYGPTGGTTPKTRYAGYAVGVTASN